jgi:cell division protein ZapA
MSVQITGTTVEILGKSYQLKCAAEETATIQQAAEFLYDKMEEVRQKTHLLSVDRIAVLAALTITHQLLALEERLKGLQNQLDKAFPPSQLELSSAE